MSTELRLSLPRLLAIYARHRPQRLALVTPFGQRSFGALHANANRLANRFLAAGLEPGARLLLLCGNRPEFVETMVAAERTGVSVVPLVYDLKPPELRHVIRNSAAQACLVDASLEHRMGAVGEETKEMKLRLVTGGSLDGFESYGDTIATAPATSPPQRPRGFPVYFTSGTTGRPKGVLARPDLSPLATALPEIYGFRAEGDCLLCPFPLFHAGIFVIAITMPLAAGATVRLLSEFDPVRILETIARERVTHAYLSPYVFHLLRSLGEERLAQYDLSPLRCVIHGAAPCPVELKRWVIQQLGPIVAEYYGASEGGGSCITAAEWLRKPGSVGRPSPALDVKILDDSGAPCSAGMAGLVYFRASAASRFEYLGDPAKTAAAYCGDHFTVRDIGHLDEDGYLFLVGRDADIANIGGYNVYPEEIDQTLAAHPAVAEALSFSVPAEDKGEKIVSWVRRHGGGEANGDLRTALLEHCRGNLARHKWPSVIEFVDVLPRSAIGKKQRHRARQQFLEHAIGSYG